MKGESEMLNNKDRDRDKKKGKENHCSAAEGPTAATTTGINIYIRDILDVKYVSPLYCANLLLTFCLQILALTDIYQQNRHLEKWMQYSTISH